MTAEQHNKKRIEGIVKTWRASRSKAWLMSNVKFAMLRLLEDCAYYQEAFALMKVYAKFTPENVSLDKNLTIKDNEVYVKESKTHTVCSYLRSIENIEKQFQNQVTSSRVTELDTETFGQERCTYKQKRYTGKEGAEVPMMYIGNYVRHESRYAIPCMDWDATAWIRAEPYKIFTDEGRSVLVESKVGYAVLMPFCIKQ